MQVKFQNNQLILSNPETSAEAMFMNTVHALITQIGAKKIEFAVNSMASGDTVTHVGLTPIVPEDYEISTIGSVVFVDRKDREEDHCQWCGGPNH